MSRRLLIIGAYSPLNRGDAAIVAAMRDAARSVDPSVDLHVHVFSTDADLFRSELDLDASPGLFAVPVLGTRLRRLRWLIPNVLVAGVILIAGIGGRRTLAIVRLILPGSTAHALGRMLDADVVMAAGGGYLTDHHYAILPFLLLEIWVATRACQTVVLGAQTIGPMRRRWAIRLLKWSLGQVAEIEARDEYTVQFLARSAPRLLPLVRRVPDFAFSYRQTDDSLAQELRLPRGEQVVVGISVRSWPFPDSDDPVRAQRAYGSAFGRAIERFVERGWRVVVMATNHPSSGSRDDDVAAGEAIVRTLPPTVQRRVHVVAQRASAAQLRSLIGACDVFIGTRMHACIFAISCDVPTLLIPYEPKGRGLMERLGRSQDVCAPDPLEADTLVAGADRLLAERARGERQVPPDVLVAFAAAALESMRRWLS